MIWFLERKKLLLCRLSLKFPTGFVLGPFSRSRIDRFWLWRPQDNWYRWPHVFFICWHMDGGIVYGLIASRVCVICFILLVGCFLLGRGWSTLQDYPSTWCIVLRVFNKVFHYQKIFELTSISHRLPLQRIPVISNNLLQSNIPPTSPLTLFSNIAIFIWLSFLKNIYIG